MKKLILFLSLALTGAMTSCVEKYEEVDADSKPEWLHGSIYEELKNPSSGTRGLQGTFSNYVRLIDDLGESETLNRTGSKTIFPANDEAFARFYQDNLWGVKQYEDLTLPQKKLLLYSSMIDNALLTGMLSNVSGGSSTVERGRAMKHETNMSVTDSITYRVGKENMPANNKYWTKYYTKGVHLVEDATVPMMVHLTREQMLNNGITVNGEGSDFHILTGSVYDENSASVYIFDNKVVVPDVTCMNGYVHQLENVLVPPGNLAQVIRNNPEASYYSRVLDYFSAPYYHPNTTKLYNDWAQLNGEPLIDSIFQTRYFNSQRDQEIQVDPNGNAVKNLLPFNPGWNQYVPASTNVGSSGVDKSLSEIATAFVPDDKAFEDFFLNDGLGEYLIDIYGVHKGEANTKENLAENLDSLFARKPEVLTTFLKNLLRERFSENVPSKFHTIVSDAAEDMGMKLELVKTTADGRYDIRMANNGVVYMLNTMVAPDEYTAVLAPSSTYPDLSVMNWAVQDRAVLGLDFKYYLLAMSANYAFFIPDDEAFLNSYYVDPVSLGKGKGKAEAIQFYYDTRSTTPTLVAQKYYYDAETNELGEKIVGTVTPAAVADQLADILNYHTVVLPRKGDKIGDNGNKYYKTKHGGTIMITGNTVGAKVMSGAQIDNNYNDGKPAPVIDTVYNQKNGHAYRINRVIEAPRNSVNKVLELRSDMSVYGDDRFSEFYQLCNGFSSMELLEWAGISGDIDPKTQKTEQDRYIVFTNTRGSGTNAVERACLDYNVKFFNTYNYTLYAPNNAAMQRAYADGLPNWLQVQALFDAYVERHEESGENEDTEEDIAAKAKAKKMIDMMNSFVRHHFQAVSVYADNVVEGASYQTMLTDELGVAEEIRVSGGGNKLIVNGVGKDGKDVVVDANNPLTLVNKMARDYWFDKAREQATEIYTSSFCVVHEIDDAFYGAWVDAAKNLNANQ